MEQGENHHLHEGPRTGLETHGLNWGRGYSDKKPGLNLSPKAWHPLGAQETSRLLLTERQLHL